MYVFFNQSPFWLFQYKTMKDGGRIPYIYVIEQFLQHNSHMIWM